MSIHVGQVVETSAHGGLRARTSPGGPIAKDDKGRQILRPRGFRFKVRQLSGDRRWARAINKWYSVDFLVPAGAASDKRLRSPKASVAAARRQLTCKVGMCLSYVQEWLGGVHGIPVAAAAWDASKQKHPGDKNPPAGVPVFWHPRPGGSKFGHIALSVGNGRIRTTDFPKRGMVSETKIDNIQKRWGLVYAGWAGDMPPAGDIPGVRG